MPENHPFVRAARLIGVAGRCGPIDGENGRMDNAGDLVGLPAGFTLALDEDCRYDDTGTVLWGGSPRRLMRLTPAGAEIVRRLGRGAAVDDHVSSLLARRLVEAGLAHPRPRPPDDRARPEIEVVVPVRDRATDLAALLEALGPALRTTVVDDASHDGAAVAAVADGYGATVVRLPSNVGPAGARNAGLAATTAPVVAFVDSDCRISAAELAALADHLADPSVAAVAPRVRPTRTGSVVARYADGRSPLDLGARPATVGPEGRVTYVPAAALVVRRTALDAVGGFDSSLRYGEDVDLVWRLHDAGWSVRYEPRVVARHREPDSWSTWLMRRFHYGSSAGPLATRHGSRLAGPALAGLVAPVTLARRTRGKNLPPGVRLEVATSAPATTALGVLRWGVPLFGPLAMLRIHRPAVRAGIVVAAALPPLFEWWQRRPQLDPIRWTGLAVSDDLAYGAGVWFGCLRAKSVTPLLPRVRGRPSIRGGHSVSGSRQPSFP